MSTGTVVDVVMPQMGVSVSEGTISRWLKNEGDTIEKDETLLEISTDKVDTEVPSPTTGVVTKIYAQEGDTLDVGAKLAEISPQGAGSPATSAPAPEPAPPAPVGAPVAAPLTPAAPTGAPASAPAPAAPSANGNHAPQTDRRFVSPVVSRIAAEHGIDVASVPGTGGGGRVTKKDIMAFIANPAAASATPSAPAQSFAAAPAPSAAPQAAHTTPVPTPQAATPTPGFTGEERVLNFSAMRKAISRHMIESRQTSAHVTSTVEVDMTRVVNMRNQIKSELQQTWDVNVTFTHFVIRAMIDAIAAWPLINAEIRGDSAVIKSYVNLGVAVALDNGEGLIVPVIKNAEEKNLVGLARSVNDLATRARTKKLSPDDVHGGTITLTNPGIFGAIHGTPILNQPQVAIVDTEAIVKRPVVITDADGNDNIAIRSMMNICMSYDHRLIDGAYAVQFLAHLKRNLQEWDLSRFRG